MTETATRFPDPVAVKTTAYSCYSCKRHACTIPVYEGEEGLGECESCGCTSYDTADGRTIGPRSAKWPLVLQDFRMFEESGMLMDHDDIRAAYVMPEGFEWPKDEP